MAIVSKSPPARPDVYAPHVTHVLIVTTMSQVELVAAMGRFAGSQALEAVGVAHRNPRRAPSGCPPPLAGGEGGEDQHSLQLNPN